jgi:hypothetical protein
MYLYIEHIDVVANIFINSNKQEFLYSELDDYANAVIKLLNNQLNIHAIYNVSNESQRDLFIDYSDYFEEYINSNGVKGVKLKQNVETEQLFQNFIEPLWRYTEPNQRLWILLRDF